MDAWNTGTHGRSGLTDRVRASTVDEAEARAPGDRVPAALRPEGHLADVRQQHLPGPALPRRDDAEARGVLPLPQPRRQHAQGAGPALAARAARRLSARRRRTRRSPTSRSRSTSSRTTASTSCAPRRGRACANRAGGVESWACRKSGLALPGQRIAAIRSSPLTVLGRTPSARRASCAPSSARKVGGDAVAEALPCRLASSHRAFFPRPDPPSLAKAGAAAHEPAACDCEPDHDLRYPSACPSPSSAPSPMPATPRPPTSSRPRFRRRSPAPT